MSPCDGKMAETCQHGVSDGGPSGRIAMTRPPAAVVRVVGAWQAHGRPRQPATRWPRKRWLVAFPESSRELTLLPDYLDRATVRAACLGAPSSPAAARRAFLVVMAWGYGTVGFGPWRTARILQESSHAPDRLARVAQQLAHRGALDAYGLLGGDCRLRGLGPAFGTKYLYFCPQSDAGPQALIFDRLVAGWLAQHAGVRLNPVSWSPRTYCRYLELVSSWAAALGIACDEVEQCIFQTQSNKLGNQWADKDAGWRKRTQ
jgi:hypothetical protein